MPVVTVQMWTGRTPAQKRALCKAITDAMVRARRLPSPPTCTSSSRKCPKEDWALAGVMGDERKD